MEEPAQKPLNKQPKFLKLLILVHFSALKKLLYRGPK